MADSIREQIAQAIATQLATITTANGYQQDIASVTRPRKREDFSPGNLKALLLVGNRVRDHELADDGSGGNPPSVSWRQNFHITALVVVSDANLTPLDTLMDAFTADVERALMEDPQWGGLAINSMVIDDELVELGSNVIGRDLMIEVLYRVAENDPTVSRT